MLFFLNRSDLDKRLRQLRLELQRVDITEELRGWSWASPPIEPPLNGLYISVSELASRYCETLRDIYLRRVEGIPPPPSLKMIEGLVYHAIASEAISQVKGALFEQGIISGSDIIEKLAPRAKEGCEQVLKGVMISIRQLNEFERSETLGKSLNFYRFLIVQAAAQVDRILSKFHHIDVDSLVNLAIPPVVERKVDGSMLGLSKELSVDLYTPANAVADLKTGEIRSFHKYALTGYTLALEADEEVAVNFGLTIYIKMKKDRPVPMVDTRYFVISDELRREFLDIRDSAFEIIQNEKDPGKPSSCPSYCPYIEICRRI
ncbi:MAG: type I-A CRISPR-associated protein Cas4/Csa1 [Candidatus Bathyarchaeia archaeon]